MGAIAENATHFIVDSDNVSITDSEQYSNFTTVPSTQITAHQNGGSNIVLQANRVRQAFTSGHQVIGEVNADPQQAIGKIAYAMENPGTELFEFVSPRALHAPEHSRQPGTVHLLQKWMQQQDANGLVINNNKITSICLVPRNPQDPDCCRRYNVQYEVDGQPQNLIIKQAAPMFSEGLLSDTQLLDILRFCQSPQQNKAYTEPLFMSYSGSIRAPALAVLTQAKQAIKDKKLCANNIDQFLSQAIEKGRQDRGPNFLNHELQCKALKKAIQSLLNEQTVQKPPVHDDRKPWCKPHELQVATAFLDQSRIMQCGRQAMNAFFQAPVFTTEQTAADWAACLKNLPNSLQFNGLYHPELLQKIINREPEITIQKDWFPDHINQEVGLRVGDYDRTPEEMWETLVELKFPNKSWLNDGFEPSQTQSLTITADHWFSAMPGLGFDQVKDMINKKLEELKAPVNQGRADWAHLPDAVEHLNINPINIKTYNAFVGKLQTYLDQNPGKQIALVVLTGTSDEFVNHFYTIVYQHEAEPKRWLKLDSHQGEPGVYGNVDVFCEHNNLAQCLESAMIQAVITPQLAQQKD